jgi:hypothetical protein
MPDYNLPFPGFDLAEKELSYDYCYGKIPENDRAPIVKMAWDRGAAAAKDTFTKFNGEEDFIKIATESGLSFELVDKDYIIGKMRTL